MNREALVEFLCSCLRRIAACAEEAVVDENTPIFGRDGLLSSMQMVELMLELEDYCQEHGASFDWAGDATFSSRRSAYRSVGALADALTESLQQGASS